MSRGFAELMFTPHVQALQQQMGSRAAYARLVASDAPVDDRLGQAEKAFIEARDSFYIATVSETGWPYVQHRGGPTGFLKVLDDRTIGFADFRGNRQYVSVGNIATEHRVSLFLMDYPNQRRLKLIGHARVVETEADPDLLEPLSHGYKAHVERGLIILIDGFDWNCPQHITPRFTESELHDALSPLRAKLRALEEENRVLRAKGRPSDA